MPRPWLPRGRLPRSACFACSGNIVGGGGPGPCCPAGPAGGDAQAPEAALDQGTNCSGLLSPSARLDVVLATRLSALSQLVGREFRRLIPSSVFGKHSRCFCRPAWQGRWLRTSTCSGSPAQTASNPCPFLSQLRPCAPAGLRPVGAGTRMCCRLLPAQHPRGSDGHGEVTMQSAPREAPSARPWRLPGVAPTCTCAQAVIRAG